MAKRNRSVVPACAALPRDPPSGPIKPVYKSSFVILEYSLSCGWGPFVITRKIIFEDLIIADDDLSPRYRSPGLDVRRKASRLHILFRRINEVVLDTVFGPSSPRS